MLPKWRVFLCLSTMTCQAIQLIKSADRMEPGKDFTLTCQHTGTYSGISFIADDVDQCVFQLNCDVPDCKFQYNCDTDKQDYSLTIPGSFMNDSYHNSKWMCENLLGSFSNYIVLFIVVPVTNVVIKSSAIGIAVGTNQTFSCTTNAGRPNANIQWYLSDGTNLTSSATQEPDCGPCIKQIESTSDLVYIGKLIDHGKTLNCVASNLDGRQARSHNISIEILYGPTYVDLQPNRTHYIVNETYGSIGPISCTAECRPNCTMTWSGPNVPARTSVLKLENINKGQAGDYLCTAKNNVSNMSSALVKVVVNHKSSNVSINPNKHNYIVNEVRDNVGPINCSADCIPKCSIKWKGPTLSDETSSVLVLKNITRNQEGEYWCVANNILGSTDSTKINITVNYGPTDISFNPNRLSYSVNESTGSVGPINCTADCKPSCSIRWFGPNLFGTSTQILNLKNVYRNQTGDYWCMANNTVGNMTSGIVTVYVNHGPSKVSFYPLQTFYTVNENTGSVGPINCTAECRPSCKMKWSGPNLPDNTTVLFLENIRRYQAGDYNCTASNSYGSAFSSTISLIVNYGPGSVLLNTTTRLYIVNETTGSVGPISCTADCNPNCTISWRGPNLSGGTSVLFLQKIHRNQTGKYQCEASNIINGTESNTVTVTVNYAPTIINMDGNTTYFENDTAEFYCIVDSYPNSIISWKFIDGNTAILLPKEKKYEVHENILRVSKMDCLAMGLYKCEANNLLGKAEKNLSVAVKCAPRLNTIEYKLNHTIAVQENQPLLITAPIIAYPEPWIYWQFVLNSSGINITSTTQSSSMLNRHFSNVLINNVTEDDYGLYAVFAGNEIGSTGNYIGIYQVQAAKRPNKPSNISCSTGNSFIIVNWQPEFDGGSAQSFRVYYKTEGEQTFLPHHKNVTEDDHHAVMITNLQSASVYLVKVYATNIYNFTESEVIHCSTSTKASAISKSLVAAGIGAGVGSAVVVIFVILVVLFFFRRLRTKSSGNEKSPIKRSNDEQEDTDELTANPLYVSSVGDSLNQSVTYGQVLKKKKEDKGKKSIEMGCVYENSEDIINGKGQIYANQQEMEISPKQYNPQKNKDGLIYADLDFVLESEGRRFVIRGMDNRNNYAIIDLSKKIDPLPSDGEDTE